MALLQITSPLQWPSHIAPTERMYRQVNPQFQLNMQEREALTFLEDELERTPQIASAIFSCDATGLQSNMPVQYISKNTGAALRVTMDDARFYLCCDRWQSLAHNMYALHLGLRYYRQLSEWGLGSMPLLMGGLRETAASNGTTISGATAAGLADWQRILGLGPTATLEDANTLYRARARTIGENDQEQLRALNIAIQEARQALGG